MIWILLAALGVPLWLVLGALGAGLLSRRAFTRAPGVFRAKLRATAGTSPGFGPSWPRQPVYARWVHDVLLVHQGLALVRNRALPVAQVPGPLVPAGPSEVKRLGPAPVTLSVVLDNGAVLQVAAAPEAREDLGGPFATVVV
jgi:hypothetical protein